MECPEVDLLYRVLAGHSQKPEVIGQIQFDITQSCALEKNTAKKVIVSGYGSAGRRHNVFISDGTGRYFEVGKCPWIAGGRRSTDHHKIRRVVLQFPASWDAQDRDCPYIRRNRSR